MSTLPSSSAYNTDHLLQNYFKGEIQKELSEHAELADLEDSSAKETSAPLSTDATPQPGPSGPTRIKLVSNSNGSNGQANGGSSGAQSDDE